jgi:hypothetical protein
MIMYPAPLSLSLIVYNAPSLQSYTLHPHLIMYTLSSLVHILPCPQ